MAGATATRERAIGSRLAAISDQLAEIATSNRRTVCPDYPRVEFAMSKQAAPIVATLREGDRVRFEGNDVPGTVLYVAPNTVSIHWDGGRGWSNIHPENCGLLRRAA